MTATAATSGRSPGWGDMTELEDSLQGQRLTPQEIFRVDLTVIARIYLAPALARFSAMYPELSIRLNDQGHQLSAKVRVFVDFVTELFAAIE